MQTSSKTLLAILLLLCCVGCGQQASTAISSAVEVTSTPVTIDALPAALPTGDPDDMVASTAAAATMRALGTIVPVPTQTSLPGGVTQDDLRATELARATLSPLPTAAPASVKNGEPASARVERSGLELVLHLPRNGYFMGELGRAEVELRNIGQESYYVQQPGASLIDELGQPVWISSFSTGHELAYGPPLRPHELAPGQTITTTVLFQVPHGETAAGHSYSVWAAATFARPAISTAGSDNIWHRLESGPIKLQLGAAPVERTLKATVVADRAGWRLAVVDGNGNVPAAELSGGSQVFSSRGSSTGPLAVANSGVWESTWERVLLEDGFTLRYSFWVGAPGYVTAFVSGTVEGTVSDPTPQPSPTGTFEGEFATLEDAEAALGIAIPAPHDLPQGTVLEEVKASLYTAPQVRAVNVQQAYRLAGGAMLRFYYWQAPQQDSAVLHQNHDPDRQPLNIGASVGWVKQSFGAWQLEWSNGDQGYSLNAPIAALTLAQLQQIASSIR